jgi:hypothetical protein
MFFDRNAHAGTGYNIGNCKCHVCLSNKFVIIGRIARWRVVLHACVDIGPYDCRVGGDTANGQAILRKETLEKLEVVS